MGKPGARGFTFIAGPVSALDKRPLPVTAFCAVQPLLIAFSNVTESFFLSTIAIQIGSLLTRAIIDF